MKKIKHISQLYLEQKTLRVKELELEKAIRNDWKEIKLGLRPANLGREFLSAAINKKSSEKINSDDILTGSLSYGATLLTKKLVEKVEEKVSDLFSK